MDTSTIIRAWMIPIKGPRSQHVIGFSFLSVGASSSIIKILDGQNGTEIMGPVSFFLSAIGPARKRGNWKAAAISVDKNFYLDAAAQKWIVAGCSDRKNSSKADSPRPGHQ